MTPKKKIMRDSLLSNIYKTKCVCSEHCCFLYCDVDVILNQNIFKKTYFETVRGGLYIILAQMKNLKCNLHFETFKMLSWL